ncbi:MULTISPECIES: aromatic ring-hydroxylating oxygenase subunit alpha [Haloferacaceae]|uniref:Aromatic ring-hydroxylating dioxygenase subunit alpha n=1 Tax=Halorubrum glutamatedens TaxID=2707018 RepID=A0ABD5QRD0_9EURY|nr:Rieske 2Fe-2S domain-containing protein [Halobellus captivus]
MATGTIQEDVPDRVQSIIDDVGKVSETGEIPTRIHNDSEIFELERDRVFGESWVFIGHESEIPEAGDYAKRYIADNPVIFVRDENDEIRVLFDACRHRGTTVVRAEQGNTTHFRCPYHNWTYKNTGELVGVPHKEQCYQELDTCEYALQSPPQVDTYAGLVFACLSEDTPPLEEYLGDFRWYLDIAMNFAEGGLEVVGEPIRWEADTSWKIAADNFTGDAYHVPAAHKSTMDLDIFPSDLTALAGNRTSLDVIDCGGHSCSFSYFEESPGGYPEEIYSDDHLSELQYKIAKNHVSIVGTVFPNLSFNNTLKNADPDNRELTKFLTIRKWQPVAPDKTQIWNWILVPKNASEEFKEQAYDTGITTFSVSGNFEVDDFAVWDGITEAAGSSFTRRSNRQSNYQMNMDEMGDAEDISDEWDGPGTVINSAFEDGTMRTFYQSWYRTMTGQRIDGSDDNSEHRGA